MNWKIFDLKYDKQEQWAFEQMAYLLFCAELDNHVGLFRYKNQTGIETEPLEKEGVFYGFQAKYYTTPISKNKEDIIDSLKKAKSKNNELNTVYLYLNKELSESSKPNEKKPRYQKEIEAVAKEIDIIVEWRVPSHIELQLTQPANGYINDIFFSLEKNNSNLIDAVIKHNESILHAIQTEIPIDKDIIKIDRELVVKGILGTLKKEKNIIISGEGGCGKTAILKEFYNLYSTKFPICVFKATELNVSNINDLFHFNDSYSLSEFIEAFNDEPLKVFVIDSAEKLAELTNNDVLSLLIQKLTQSGWSILFTTRYSYLNDLKFHIKENYNLNYVVEDIPLLDGNKIQLISQNYNFNLPENQRFLERLNNLFYLSEYVKNYSQINKKGNLKEFIDLLWRKRIQNNLVQKDNLHIERERCLISIVKERCNTGRFYIKADELPQHAIFHLKQDEILGYNESVNGYFITHDIYEEWTLNKILSRNYNNYLSIQQFFEELGDSLPIRRAFRIWLSDQLCDNRKEIENYIQEVFTNNEISEFWKDELLVSVLLSNYSEVFFELFANEIKANDFKILKRILFLLRIACTDISGIENGFNTRPKGKGWESVITYVYKHRIDFFEPNFKLILPLLIDWSKFQRFGKETRYCGLLALGLIEKSQSDSEFYLHGSLEDNVFTIIFSSAEEIQDELSIIFDNVVENKWINHGDPYKSLCSSILEKPYLAQSIINFKPLSIIKLCDIFWRKQKPIPDERGFNFDRDSMESRYGLTDRHEFNYSPASANQTPVYWLLRSNFKDTLNFIIDFIDDSVESYRQSDYGQDVEKVILDINGNKKYQFLSPALWTAYRGTGSPVVPYLFQSIHMALEKFLIEISNEVETKITQGILFTILNKSKSASITAVVCSIVLLHPHKFYEIAIILFKTIDFFHIDAFRSRKESKVNSLYSIGYGMDKISDILYADERLKTCKEKHRKSYLELLFLDYQLRGIKGFSEKQNEQFIGGLYKIIDKYKSNLFEHPKFKENSWDMLLARMDRRNLVPKVSNDGDNILIEFSPKELSEDLRERSEKSLKNLEELSKYSSLSMWSDFLSNSQNKSTEFKEYNENPLLALTETKQLVEDLDAGKNTSGYMDYTIPGFVCSKLLIEHRDILNYEDFEYCKNIVFSYISDLLSDDYDYQIGDGVEACVHALPIIINESDSTEEIEEILLEMILILLDKRSLGHYKRVCDYVIESIHKTGWWNQNSRYAEIILFGFINIQPIYKAIVEEKRKEKRHWGWQGIPKSEIFKQLEEKTSDLSLMNIEFNIKDIDFLDIHDLEIVYKLIPVDTKNSIHIDIYSKSLPIVTSQLLKDHRSYIEEFGDRSDIHSLRRKIFKRISYFILCREENEIDTFFKPILELISSSEETTSLIEELISAEDYLGHAEQFWYVWNMLYLRIVEIATKSKNYRLEDLIIAYLLAWRWWKDDCVKWHSLNHSNISFYDKISNEIGHIPSVLYSISRVLNTVGSNFSNEGIDWIYNIIRSNTSLEIGKLESNTLFYLERLMRKYIYSNKQKIKKEVRVKNKIIPILNFMIERGSIHGYLLRESVL